MRKIKKILLSAFICFCFIPVAQAAENIGVKKTEISAKPGENVEMELLSKTDTIIIGATFTVVSPSQYLQLDKVTTSKGNIEVKQNNVTITETNVKKGEVLAKVTYRVLAQTPLETSGTIAFSKILLYNQKGNEINDTDAFSVKVSVQNQTNGKPTLKSLSIEESKLSFIPDTFSYQLKVPNNVNELHIKAEPTASNAKVEVKGSTLIAGENTVTITVTEGSASSEYILLVTREKEEEKVEVAKPNYTTMYVFLIFSIIVVVADIIYMIKRK